MDDILLGATRPAQMEIAGCPKGWIRQHGEMHGMQRAEAYFAGNAYEMHRHDTYAIGQTLSGVQSFRYRGSLRHSLPGDVIALHPDELHDGRAGSEHGFGYRIIYIPPSSLRSFLGREALPHVAGGIASDPRLLSATRNLLTAREAFAFECAFQEFAQALLLASDARYRPRPARFDERAVGLASAYLSTLPLCVTMDALERIAGCDRWSLARGFRAAYGTSPYRFLVMRRLEAAQRHIAAGQSIADAAYATGFADQSHLARQFKRAYGISPGRWKQLQTAGRA